jgi:tetrahydromethanopterin S-methyltransferase subunit F
VADVGCARAYDTGREATGTQKKGVAMGIVEITLLVVALFLLGMDRDAQFKN